MLKKDYETFIFTSLHADIDVIVPRNDALMTNSPQQATTHQEVAYLIFNTEVIEHIEHIIQYLLMFCQG